MKYYKSCVNGEVYSEYEIERAAKILLIEKRIAFQDFDEIRPSVIDFLKGNNKIAAIRLYHDIHNCSLNEARYMIQLITADMMKFSRR